MVTEVILQGMRWTSEPLWRKKPPKWGKLLGGSDQETRLGCQERAADYHKALGRTETVIGSSFLEELMCLSRRGLYDNTKITLSLWGTGIVWELLKENLDGCVST